jgi:arylsulfatase A-like enzyme
MATINSYYRARLQALQGVDEMVDALVTELDKMGILDNTFIFYTSDNGGSPSRLAGWLPALACSEAS